MKTTPTRTLANSSTHAPPGHLVTPPLDRMPRDQGRQLAHPSPPGHTMTTDLFATPPSDSLLLETIAELRQADYLGSWGRTHLEKLEAEARLRKLTKPPHSPPASHSPPRENPCPVKILAPPPWRENMLDSWKRDSPMRRYLATPS